MMQHKLPGWTDAGEAFYAEGMYQQILAPEDGSFYKQMAGAFPNSEYVQYSECALNMEVPGYTSNFYPQNMEFSLPESRYEYMEAGDRTPWTWGDQSERGFHGPELQVGPALQEQEMLGFQDGRWEHCPPPCAPRLERLERSSKSSVPLVSQAELLPLGLLDSPVHSPSSSHPAPSESNENYGPDIEGRALRDMLKAHEKRGLPREYHHSRVPRNVNFQEECESHPTQEITTLMIRNIPNRYTQQELIAELADLGFAGTFNFLYIPLDKGTMSNVGYAFVNFVTKELASKCIETFQGYRFKRHRKTSGKVAAISAAHLQGLEANLAHYEKSAVNTAKLKNRRPVVMANISTGVNDDKVA